MYDLVRRRRGRASCEHDECTRDSEASTRQPLLAPEGRSPGYSWICECEKRESLLSTRQRVISLKIAGKVAIECVHLKTFTSFTRNDERELDFTVSKLAKLAIYQIEGRNDCTLRNYFVSLSISGMNR